MEKILKDLGLSILLQKFKDERIDETIALSLTDSELIRLGVGTIGDRVRFRELCKEAATASTPSADNTTASTSASGQTTENGGLNQQLRRERALLFNPRNRSARGRNRNTSLKKEGKKRTWTANFVCLSDRLTNKVPSSTAEKQVLQKAGLGSKKIKFDVDDNETTVIEKLTCSDADDNGDVCGFPKLKDGGGFEMMHCVANCITLSVLECAWSVK